MSWSYTVPFVGLLIQLGVGAASAQEPSPPDAAPQEAQDAPGPEDAEALPALEAEIEEELGSSPEEPAPASGAAGVTPTDLGRVMLLPDVSAALTASIGYYSDVPTPRLRGHEPDHDRRGLSLQLQELELAIQGVADPYVRADVFVGFAPDSAELEQAFVTTLSLPASLQLRAGLLPAEVDRFNTRHYLMLEPFADMPLVHRRFFGGHQLVGIGMEVSWLTPLPWFVEITFEVITADNPVSFGLPASETVGAKDVLTVGRLEQFFELTDTWSLMVGASAAQGPNNSGGRRATASNRTQLAGGDVMLKWRDLATVRQLRCILEYIVRRATVPGGRTIEGGAYLQVDYRLGSHLEVAARADYFGLPSLLRGELAFGDVTGAELLPFLTPSRQWRVGGSVSFYASEYHLWRLQYNLDRLLGDDAGLVGRRDPVHEVFLLYQVILGTHGAHPF